LAGKRVLVLSDNAKLSRAIELNLSRHLEVVRPAPGLPGQPGNQAEIGSFDLIVVGMSLPVNDPVMLTGSLLAGQVSPVPMLIISERPFHSDPNRRIVHMDFLFDVHRLYESHRDPTRRTRDDSTPIREL
jgi:DNA-binding response OmpR family regulator